MCTVTYIPPVSDNGFILTSNRDEKAYRPTIAPEIYDMGSLKVCFPKDTQAGGSWIAANNKGRLCCLLNGAFVAHQKQIHHTQSRGKVLIEVASSPEEASEYFQKKELSSIEPFTILTLNQEKGKISNLSEFIWDGTQKHFRELDKQQPWLWSSVTLYSPENRELRKQWFRRFLQVNEGDLTLESVISFHSGTHTSDNSINIIMQREGGLRTISITQVVPYEGKFRMNYFDLLDKTNHQIEI